MASRMMLSRVARRVSASRFTGAVASLSTETLVVGIGKGKTSTGLVGLKVDHEWQPHMISKYQALLDRMAESDMPDDAVYRVTMEKVIRYRLKAAMENPEDPEKVEELCNCGQVEELVQQADDEMEVLEMYLKGRYWEQVEDVDIEYNPNPEDDHGDGIDWGDTPETMHAEKKITDSLVTEFCAKNQELLDLVGNSHKRDPYLTNVRIVARHRLHLGTMATDNKQLEKLCNRGSLQDLIKQAKTELERVSEYCRKT